MGTATRDSDIASALFGTVRQRVLALLFGHADEALYVRRITRAVGAGQGAVQRELQRLVNAGLLVRRRDGNQVFYQANRQSPVFSDLHGLIIKTVGIADVLREALTPLREQIALAFVFGSIAERTATNDSDVDILIITTLSVLDLVSALSPAQSRLAREINPVRMTPEELANCLQRDDHFVETVLDGPKIFLIGEQNELDELTANWASEEA